MRILDILSFTLKLECLEGVMGRVSVLMRRRAGRVLLYDIRSMYHDYMLKYNSLLPTTGQLLDMSHPTVVSRGSKNVIYN